MDMSIATDVSTNISGKLYVRWKIQEKKIYIHVYSNN